MNARTPSYHGYRFPSEIISHAVWLYYRFCLSFRGVEDLLAKRSVIVSYETIRQWSRKFGAECAREWIDKNSDLDPIRAHPRFQATSAKLD
jgi:putative transposase